MEIVKENETKISIMLDSLVELLDMECPSSNQSNKNRFNKFKNQIRSNGWYGPTCDSAKEIIDNALLGDKYLYEKYLIPKIKLLGDSQDVKDSEQSIQIVKRKRTRGSQGDELDIHRVYQGQLDKAWSKSIRVEVAQKFHLVTLLIDYGGNSSESATNSLWRTAVVVRLAEELERAGKSVQIIASFACTGSSISHNKMLSSSLMIKKYNEKLSMERLAAMSHIGSFRVFGFLGIVCQEEQATSDLGYDSGVSIENMPIHLQEEIDGGHMKVVIIGRASDIHSAKQKLADAYKQMDYFAN